MTKAQFENLPIEIRVWLEKYAQDLVGGGMSTKEAAETAINAYKEARNTALSWIGKK